MFVNSIYYYYYYYYYYYLFIFFFVTFAQFLAHEFMRACAMNEF